MSTTDTEIVATLTDHRVNLVCAALNIAEASATYQDDANAYRAIAEDLRRQQAAQPEQAPPIGCDEFDYPPNPLTTVTDRCPQCGENFTGRYCEACVLTEVGADQVHLLVEGAGDEDERREAVAWLLGNVKERPDLAERIATAAGLLTD